MPRPDRRLRFLGWRGRNTEFFIFILGGIWLISSLLSALGVIKPSPPRQRTTEERLRDLEDEMHVADMVVGMMAMDEMEQHFRETGRYL